jgi:hypothetical protein
LDRFNHEEKICQQCDGNCCHKFSCEFLDCTPMTGQVGLGESGGVCRYSLD